jgi:hypothetical protein
MGQSQVQICWHIIVCILQRLGLLEAMDFCVGNFRHFAKKSWEKKYSVTNYWSFEKQLAKKCEKRKYWPEFATTAYNMKVSEITFYFHVWNITKFD